MIKARTLIRACKDCGVVADYWTTLSQKGLCTPCSKKRMLDAIDQLRNKEGPVYLRWLYGIKHFRDRKDGD
jgi:hypothetical protein